ncbi:hypothetical protein D1BOALGB6SA_750 [Olavius sp. associated proteobacterium Delta 1]|nr:hypothetical protein D1BOALGB6SA_750 [Olavius sp. associated proteobacterium Delta 1]
MAEGNEVGPVVVPEGWDYAAARMRKGEERNLRRRNVI